MQEIQLERHIAKLLRRNDQLTLPELGTFIGSYQSAVYDEANDTFNPPNKSVLFQSKMILDDQLLIHSLKSELNESLGSIQEEVQLVISEWKVKLEKGERIEIEQFGYLFQDTSGAFKFKQDSFQNLLVDSYGLKQVEFITRETFIHAEEVLFEPELEPTNSLKVLEQEEPSFTLERPAGISKENKPSISLKDSPEVIAADAKNTNAPVKKAKFNKRYLIALALVPIAFYAYWIPVKTSTLDTGKIQMAELNPFRSEPVAQYIPEAYQAEVKEAEELSFEEQLRMLPPEVEVYSMPIDDDFYIPVKLNAPEETSINEHSTTSDNSNSTIETTNDSNDAVVSTSLDKRENKNYHLIGGCFSNKSNAKAFAKSLGENAFILDYNKGLHRVSIGQFDNRSDAKDALKEYRSSGESAWVLKK